ncbi:MAG: hypothetical protein AAF914_15540, partial [Pseudomonadota bacterium]
IVAEVVRAMFEGDAKIFLFLAAAAAGVLTMAADRNAPRAPLSTAVETDLLPRLPLTAERSGAPAQTDIDALQVELGGGFEARLLYGYVLEGLVVTRREFRNDPTSEISPLDLGIVWGDLADPDRAALIDFRAQPRAVAYRASADAILTPDWEEQITNNHLIPATQAVQDALMAVEVGQNVRISGYLVVVTGDGISPWRSSVRRDDNTIIGGCEIILVTGVEVLPAEDEAA